MREKLAPKKQWSYYPMCVWKELISGILKNLDKKILKELIGRVLEAAHLQK